MTTVSTRVIRERDRGRRPLQEFGADTGRGSASARNREQTGRRVDPEYDLDLLAIERKVQSRSDPNFEHPPIGSGAAAPAPELSPRSGRRAACLRES